MFNLTLNTGKHDDTIFNLMTSVVPYDNMTKKYFFSCDGDRILMDIETDKNYIARVIVDSGNVLYDRNRNKENVMDANKLDLFSQEMYLEFEEYFIHVVTKNDGLIREIHILDEEFVAMNDDVSPVIIYTLLNNTNQAMNLAAKQLISGFAEYLKTQRYDSKDWGIEEFEKLKFIIVEFCREHISRILHVNNDGDNSIEIREDRAFATLISNYIHFHGIN